MQIILPEKAEFSPGYATGSSQQTFFGQFPAQLYPLYAEKVSDFLYIYCGIGKIPFHKLPGFLHIIFFAVSGRGGNGIQPAQQHTLRFELFDPSGKIRSEYSSWLRTKEGKVQWQWHIPCNAPGGKWLLTVRETISGIRKVIELQSP